MLLSLPKSLPGLIESKFKAAKASGALIFSSTELAVISTTTGVPFQLRYCPALGQKPTPQKEAVPAVPKKKFDPFENPVPELFIVDLPTTNPSHYLVLNKFPVIPNHFILATKTHKHQSHVLEEDDLAATYACLQAYEDTPNGLFSFFNSGVHSGASQPHRHIQFLPIDDMLADGGPGHWNVLVNSILSKDTTKSDHPDLPFTHFSRRFSGPPSSSELLQIYTDLYQLAKAAVDNFIAANPGQLALHSTEEGDLPVGYNLAMTTSGMVILPRRREYCMMQDDNGAELGEVELNGTTLGGTMMVKDKEQWNILKRRSETLDTMLESVGIPLSSRALREK